MCVGVCWCPLQVMPSLKLLTNLRPDITNIVAPRIAAGVGLLVSVAVPHVKNVAWWGCVFAVLDRCKYYPPACPSVWAALSHLVLSRSLIPQNFALCLRFLLQLTHLNTPHQAVVGMAAAILAYNAPRPVTLPSSGSNASLTSVASAPAVVSVAASSSPARQSVSDVSAPQLPMNVMEARRIVSVEALKLVEAMVDSLDVESGFAEAMGGTATPQSHVAGAASEEGAWCS